MLTRVRYLLEMIRFSHTLFALPFALFASVMAWTTPTLSQRYAPFRWLDLGILICLVGARSAAMAFNRLVDRTYDAVNPRTATRHIPVGLLSIASVVIFTLVSALLFLGGTLLFLPHNPWPLWLSWPVLLFLLGYSYTKRSTALAHYWLGLALALAPISAWIAIRGSELVGSPADLAPALWLGAAVFCWVGGFDIIYACQDAQFDTTAGLYSIPSRVGVANALRLAAASHFLTVLCLIGLPIACPQVPLGVVYYFTVAGIALLLIYEHALVKPDDLSRVNVAFFQVNCLISIGLFLLGSYDLIW